MIISKRLIACVISANLLWNSSFAAIRNTEVNAAEILNNVSSLRGELTQKIETDKELNKEIEKLGLDKKEIRLRLAAMTDEELQQVQKGVQRQVGGDVVTISVTALILIILIVILIR
jgi:ribosomal protein L31E